MPKPMRIAQVVQGFPPQSLGGTETYVAHLAKALARRGHEVQVFARIADPALAEYAELTTTHDGFTVNWINNSFSRLDSFTHSYLNTAIAQRFGDFLNRCSSSSSRPGRGW